MVTDGRTNKRTDGRTNGQVDNIMRSASLDWRTQCMFADAIAIMCFHDAERVLSGITKFLVHLLGKGRGGVKCERREVGEESGE